MPTAPHNLDHERQLWDTYAESAFTDDLEPAFGWTQYRDHPGAPGPELLGDAGSVLEIGCGTGRALAHLAQRGVKGTGVDLSRVMVERASEQWEQLGVEFVQAEILEYLGNTGQRFDAVYSIFGAAWFTDPERLFPLVAAHLSPSGVFVFSQPPAIPGAYGPQGMYKGGFAGPAMYTYRYSYEPAGWTRFLTEAGFVHADVRVITAPTPGHIGTLIGRAVRP
ncbi:methyltransferase domain-containing protein [Kitasatospora sp. NBC_01250]|uniref:class I SAM-dependent methyltransferase n=1 Tax=unclassified Kitasatospora TaxID=2633591 RepID=UPI002E134FE7|nr:MULTISPECIES: methyltransferase domain-containing protein [unclassified Kitasatospora]WSJ69984.1 methyltransferase domain-containing protein [Kitasatospora sp. NBC_01302]